MFDLLLIFLPLAATAQTLPLEIRQDATRYNLGSTNGMPISSTPGTPPGSDGRGPTVAQQQAAGLTTVPATTNQFRSFIDFGAVAVPPVARRINLNAGLSYTANAENLDLPRAKVNNQILVIMPTASVGASAKPNVRPASAVRPMRGTVNTPGSSASSSGNVTAALNTSTPRTLQTTKNANHVQNRM